MMYNHNVVLILSVYFIACTFLHCIYFAPLCRILAYWLMLSVLNTTLNKDYSILFNSLAPGRSECDSKNAIFNLVLLIGIFRSSHNNALWWMPQDITDDKSTLVQVMAWCRQATSHCVSQCWLSSLSHYCVARPQWVNAMRELFNQPLYVDVACFNKIQLSEIKSEMLLVQLIPYSGYQFLYPTTKFSRLIFF